MQTINFGVIGCGIISQSHFASIRDIEGANAVAAADVNPTTLNARCDEFDVPRRYADWKELLRDEEVQAVSICLPHNLHLPAALDAVRAGKHILIEKPMANSLDECDQIMAAAEENGVTVMVAQVLRRYPSSKLTKKLIREGRIGRVASIQRRRMGDCKGNLTSYSWATNPEVAGGWLLYSYGPHEYDTILWLLDTEVESLSAVGVYNRAVWNDYDEITSIMRLKNGAMATMIQSLNSVVSAWDCVVVGETGTIYFDYNEVQLNGEKVDVEPVNSAAFREQVQEFVDSLREGREPDASGRRVRPTMRALEMVKASLEQGSTVYARDF